MARPTHAAAVAVASATDLALPATAGVQRVSRGGILVDHGSGGPAEGTTFGLPGGMPRNGRWSACNADAGGILDGEVTGRPNVYPVDLR